MLEEAIEPYHTFLPLRSVNSSEAMKAVRLGWNEVEQEGNFKKEIHVPGAEAESFSDAKSRSVPWAKGERLTRGQMLQEATKPDRN